MSTEDGDSIPSLSTDLDSTVCFPPRQHADFVVHYADTAFHVHKLVLQHHSAYFRAVFQTLSPPSGSANPLAKQANTCSHSHIAHCIHLPQQTRLVGQQAVTAADFELFLRHLYFGSHYCYPPCLPKTDVDLDADPAPLSLSFPAVSSLDWTFTSPQLRFTGANNSLVAHHESLLALAHYLLCDAMLAQCEAVLMTQVGWAEWTNRGWLEEQSWYMLPHCERYRLQKAKKAYIGVLAADRDLMQRPHFKTAQQTWDKALVAQLMEAALESRS